MLRSHLLVHLPVTCLMSNVCCSSTLSMTMRYKREHVKIANRRKVEKFLATHFHVPTRLRTAAPEIAAEWNYDKNPMHLYPEIIGIGYMDEVWWTCRVCGTSYKMSVEKRVIRGKDCPSCAHVHSTMKYSNEQFNNNSNSSSNSSGGSGNNSNNDVDHQSYNSELENIINAQSENNIKSELYDNTNNDNKSNEGNRLPGERNRMLQYKRSPEVFIPSSS